MLDPALLYDLGKLRQKELIKRGQQGTTEHHKPREQSQKSIMFDPYELQELGIERQRSLIAWRENRRESRRNLNQPLQEHAVITVPRRVFTTIINKLKSLSQARAAVAIRNRRGIR